MCLAFFEGKGYSQGFTCHMQQVLDSMADNPMLELVTGQDIVCSACPNLQDGLCNTPELVLAYDQAVLSRCGLEPHILLPWVKFSRLVKDRILIPGKREEICGSCPWTELCRSREHTPNY